MEKGEAKYFAKLSKEAMNYARNGLVGPLNKVCSKASEFACTVEQREHVESAKQMFLDIANMTRVESHLKGALCAAKNGNIGETRNRVEYAKRTAYDADLPFDSQKADGIVYSSIAFSTDNAFRKWHKLEGRPVEEIENEMDKFRATSNELSNAEKRLVEKKITRFMEGVYLSGIEEELKKAYGSGEKDVHVYKALEYAEKMGMPESDVAIIKFRAEKMKRI
ncbi:MAG: hypothetical protein HZB68_02465 [Candidatus Aenigmarchaeota archaeon]|nr:hypothetical protein [Candidatus Aenigmarchaeota archaeon]